jgi:hypothetical protein
MSKEKSGSSVKDLREEITFQLNQSLGKLKETLGEKKFETRVKKAVKLLTEDLEVSKKEKGKKDEKIKKEEKPKKASKVKIPTAKTDKAKGPAKKATPVKSAEKAIEPVSKTPKTTAKKAADKK